MTEAQQTEMDCSDPLRLLSADGVGEGGTHIGSEVDDRASSVPGLGNWDQHQALPPAGCRRLSEPFLLSKLRSRHCNTPAGSRTTAGHFLSSCLGFRTRPYHNLAV